MFDAPNPVSEAPKFMFDASYVDVRIGSSDAEAAESAFAAAPDRSVAPIAR